MTLAIPEYIEIRTATGEPVAYLSPKADGLKDVFIDIQLNSVCNLDFALPISSKKWQHIAGTNRIIAGGREFAIIKPDAITIIREGKKVWGKISAQESWILLNKKFPTVSNDPANSNPPWGTVQILSGGTAFPGTTAGSAKSALSYLLQGSGWTVGTVDVTGTHDLETEKEHLLANINKVQELWGGYLVWDSINKVLHLRSETAWQNYTGFQIRYAKNLKHITKTEDHDIVTRLYPFGADNLNIGSVNGGQLYLDDFQYTTEILEGKYENQNIDNAQELKDKAIEVLAKLSKPRYNYRVGLVDLRTLPEYNHEDFAFGDMVDVIDEELGINVRGRIIKHKYNVFQPWVCELETGDWLETLEAMIADSKRAADFVSAALKPNAGIGNILKGFVSTFATQINSANGKLVWDDSTFEAIEIDGNGNPTGKRVRVTPGGIGISTDGGQTFVTAITGAGILANVIIASELYALSSADGFTKLVSSGLKVFDGGNNLRAHFGQYATGKFGLLLKDSTGTQTILDQDGILQTWQEGRADNVDNANPLLLSVYLPPETRSIKRALLRFRLQAFRAYETGSAASGSASIQASDNGITYNTNPDFDQAVAGLSGRYTAFAGNHVHGGSTSWALPSIPAGYDHYHDYRDMYSAGDHSHDLYNHKHEITIPGHTHNITLSDHTHTMLYGIYLSTTATNATVKVNGVDRTTVLGGPFIADQSAVDITQYLTIGQWNTIELGSSRLGRIDASMFIQAMMGV